MSDFDPMSDEPQDQTQRIEWLRMRGVEVELPSDRKRTSVQTSSGAKEFVTIVKIPCDSSRAYEELRIPLDVEKHGDQLPLLLRVYFNRGTVRLEDLKEQQPQQLANADVSVTQSTLDLLGAEGAVEVFPLSHPNDSNKNCRVALYLDEVGQLKKLQRNDRAVALAATCGFKDVPLVGDMFVGRVGPAKLRHTGTALKEGLVNLDFTLQELDSGADWLKDIERLNYEHGVATGKVAMPNDSINAVGDHDLVTGQSEKPGVQWSETAEYFDVAVHIPDAIKQFTARDIAVKFEAQRVLVEIKNTSSALLTDASGTTVGAGERMLLWEGHLHGRISVEDSTWCVNLREVEINLEKTTPTGRWGKLERS